MAHQLTTSYLKDSFNLFRYYKRLADNAMAQTSDQGLLAILDPESNSIATIVKHLAGNMRSRWTNFLTSDGEKPDRNRDGEFETPPATREELTAMWEGGWKCLFDTLATLTDEDLGRTITIRGEPHSVMQAISRHLGHCAYHVGQIVYLAKHSAGSNWKALTVPRGQSAEFTARLAAARAPKQGA